LPFNGHMPLSFHAAIAVLEADNKDPGQVAAI
jgi:hypothetical protein